MPEIFENTDKVSKKILEDAQDEVKEILDAADKNAKEILDDTEQKKEIKLQDAKTEAGHRYKKIYELEISKAKSAMEQELLMQKINMINSILEKSVSTLVSVKSSRYEEFLKNTLQNLNISKGQYQIGNNEPFIKDETLKKLAGSAKLEKSAEIPDFDYGIKIIEGKTEYSISAETLIQTRIDDIRMGLSRFLFEKE